MEALQNNTTREVTPYQPTTDWGAGQNLSFRCMQTALALLIDRVREIIEYGQVTTVPMMPGYVRGVLNLRGNVVPVIDLAFRFGGKPTEVGRRTCIIILELPIGKTSQLAGLIVDAVDEVPTDRGPMRCVQIERVLGHPVGRRRRHLHRDAATRQVADHVLEGDAVA